MSLYTTYYNSPVGWLKLGCSDDFLEEVLFAEAEVSPSQSHPILQQTQTQLAEYFDGNRTAYDLPLRQSGTAFQQKVWGLLVQISYGKTISYNTLSKQYGDVKAIRAVASANGRNNLAIIVPCHRVIGANGTLTGYAGGLSRKRWLLEHEAKWSRGVQELNF